MADQEEINEDVEEEVEDEQELPAERVGAALCVLFFPPLNWLQRERIAQNKQLCEDQNRVVLRGKVRSHSFFFSFSSRAFPSRTFTTLPARRFWAG